MKKFIVLTVALVFLSTSAFAAITGSKHDFSTSGWTTEICAPCHTPHNSYAAGVGGPLWSHSTTTGTFSMYSNPATALMVAATGGTLQSESKACLSCHDGVTNMDDFIGTGGPVDDTNLMTGSAMLGETLTNDHPVSFTYDSTANTGYVLTATVQGSALVLFGASSNQLECSTCHDVHNTDGAISAMLRIANTGSTLCKTCHAK